MRRPLEKIKITPEIKEHYDTLHKWLRAHPNIQYKKLYPFGFQISVNTIADEDVNEFIEISTHKIKLF